MKYGYAVLSMIGHGELYWDEYYTSPLIRKVRTFDKKHDRDNAMRVEKKRREDKCRKNGKPFGSFEVCPFITK